MQATERMDDIRLLKCQPERRKAFLVNSQGRATLHDYSHTERVTLPVLRLRGDKEHESSETEMRAVKVFVFICSETGELRRWGCE